MSRSALILIQLKEPFQANVVHTPMLSKIKSFFQTELQAEADGQLSEHKRKLASAALLIEVAVADSTIDEHELNAMEKILRKEFGLSQAECEELTTLAKEESDKATSTYQFTQLVNDQCDRDEKYALIKAMWTIAYADGNLDKYEEHLIRKVSDLIHLSHSDFIHAKHASRAQSGIG